MTYYINKFYCNNRRDINNEEEENIHNNKDDKIINEDPFKK